jgi:iodotyrosine deiodinase
MPEPAFIPYRPPRWSEPEMRRRAREFFDQLSQRRSVRDFAPDPVPRELIELAMATAATHP